MSRLIDPSLEFEASYRSYLQELGDEPRVPFVLDFPSDDFAALVQKLDEHAAGKCDKEGFVPNSTHWWVEGGELLGVSNLRHRLNERLESYGGHIGFGVRPSARRRGVARALLRATLAVAARHGIAEAVLTCDRENRASARVITSAGGVFDREYTLPDRTEVTQRSIVPTAEFPTRDQT